jgi:large subunit ribosomal protein L4
MESKIFSNRKKKAIGLIHKVYLLQLKNRKNYLASTKTKSEVRGGGKKPWRQKGTGQARAGSTRSPLWVGGGVIFGPKFRIVKKKVNKKERRLAILSAFYLKKKSWDFLEESLFEKMNSFSKTKELVNFFQEKKLNMAEKLLIIVSEKKRNLWFISRNLKHITITTPNCLSLNELLTAKKIWLSKKSLDLIHSTYGKAYYGKDL